MCVGSETSERIFTAAQDSTHGRMVQGERKGKAFCCIFSVCSVPGDSLDVCARLSFYKTRLNRRGQREREGIRRREHRDVCVRVPVAVLRNLKPPLKIHTSVPLNYPQQVCLLMNSIRIANNKLLRVSPCMLDAHGIIENDIIGLFLSRAVD